MKAIIQYETGSRAGNVLLMGIGDDESEARQEAFAHVNHGHNNFDEEYSGGTLVDVDDVLASIMCEVDEIESPDTMQNMYNALEKLYINEAGRLATHYHADIIARDRDGNAV
ncbi:hypothetical protein HKX42_00080 [Salinisphaera sp. USBA-960]|nr:hypothetical protein [Salifodinibacter halophilus]NNC25288.1 hypothetical protein [Salifodinibacter halophilus]